ncbi:nucleotidyltransferase domain-containing protein [Prescottella subtropica]|uniref:nucleotidyltransferase domain-containing protein n=1 Tax=Prescottella subtropica TaxID=2545757 RepID=UPI0010F56796|nr:hypothetical protein [Prescottella subtropica]
MTDVAGASADGVPFDDDVPWTAWTPRDVTARLRGLCTPGGRPVRWAIAGGWALDLHLGRRTREHEDLEIVVLGADVPAVLDAFTGDDWRWLLPVDGRLFPVESPARAGTHQTWLWSVEDSAFVLDVFRDLHDGDTWICRRDPTITMQWTDVVGVTADGVPYLIPEVVLLFKAKHARDKDVADLTTVLPSLSGAQRVWLRDALEKVHPGHSWRARI